MFHGITCLLDTNLTTNISCLSLDKYEYLILICIGFCKEHTSSFLELLEGEVNVETDACFDGEIIPLIKGGRDSFLNSILAY